MKLAQYEIAWTLLRPRLPLVFGALSFAMLSAATNAGMALLVGSVAEWLFQGGSEIRRVATSWWGGNLSPGMRVVVGVAVVTVVRTVGTLGATWVTARLGGEIVHELRTKLYERVAANAIPRNLAHHRGELVSRLQDDVQTIQSTLVYAVTGIAHTLFSTLLVGGLVLSIDPLVGVACLVGAPLAMLVVRAANRRFYDLWEKLRADFGVLNSRIEEVVDVGDVIRSFGAEHRMSARFSELSASLQKSALTLAWSSALTKPLVSVAATLGLAMLVAYWHLRAAPPPTDQAALLASAAILIRPVHSVSEWYETLASVRASLVRVNELLAVPAPAPDSDSMATRAAINVLEAQDLAFSFGQHEVLSGISFSLKRGQVIAVVGESGMGKTTLLRLIAGLLESSRGALRIDEVSASQMGMREYRFHFGWVSQEARLLLDTVAANLRLGRPQATDLELARALESAGLGEQTMTAFPNGLKTVVADDGSPFSVGQRQRLCIARALVAGAPILILDEPTAALDERHAEELHDTLESLRDRVAVMVATHRLSSVKRSDWVLMLEDGKIVEQGTPADLLARGARFRRLFAQDLVEPVARGVG